MMMYLNRYAYDIDVLLDALEALRPDCGPRCAGTNRPPSWGAESRASENVTENETEARPVVQQFLRPRAPMAE